MGASSRKNRLSTAVVIAAVLAAIGATPASAAKSCDEPLGGDWERSNPSASGMDPAKLQRALDYGSSELSFAVSVYRHGCLVAEDRLAPLNRNTQFQSYSLAKSITALAFARAMTLGLISPDDPLGSVIGEADRAHGEITMEDLLTMTSGLHWNFFRDYNIFMPDRIHEALTVAVEKRPGTYYEYSQSGPTLLAESVERAAGEDFQKFVSRELFTPLGIEPGSWRWGRDRAGTTQGFFDLNMKPGDYARLGELMRLDGVWRGRRLLARDVVREALTPTETNGCYGWLIWLNAGKPCVSPRVNTRPVSDERSFPGLPHDFYYYAGLFGQVVAVFPSQDLTVVRTGLETSFIPTGGGEGYQSRLFKMILGAITDQRVRPEPDPEKAGNVSGADGDRGLFDAFREPDQFTEPQDLPPLPPAGPARARATTIAAAKREAPSDRKLALRVSCPPLSPAGGAEACRGFARAGKGRKREYRLQPGKARRLVVPLSGRDTGRLERLGRVKVLAAARNADAAQGTRSTALVDVAR